MNYHVIDKTMLIKDLPDQHNRVTLITRPRRFGKTFNLSVIQNDRFHMIYSYLKETENSSLSGIAELLSFLIRRMNSAYHKKVIVLIDE